MWYKHDMQALVDISLSAFGNQGVETLLETNVEPFLITWTWRNMWNSALGDNISGQVFKQASASLCMGCGEILLSILLVDTHSMKCTINNIITWKIFASLCRILGDVKTNG